MATSLKKTFISFRGKNELIELSTKYIKISTFKKISTKSHIFGVNLQNIPMEMRGNLGRGSYRKGEYADIYISLET